MDYDTAIEIFDTLDEDYKVKEIYAHFGLAVSIAQNLEQQMINMIAIYKQATHKIKNQEQIDSLWDNYHLGSRTFGVLINEVKQLYNLTEQDILELREVLRLRNYITHDYFRLNSGLSFSESGQKRMIKDFIEFQNRARLLDDKLINYTKVYTDKIGLKEEKIQEIFEKMKIEWQQKLITDEHKTSIK